MANGLSGPCVNAPNLHTVPAFSQVPPCDSLQRVPSRLNNVAAFYMEGMQPDKHRCLLSQVRAWFSEGLGYAYDPVADGSVPEWLANLVSTSFKQTSEEHGATMKTAQVHTPHGPMCFGCGQTHETFVKSVELAALSA